MVSCFTIFSFKQVGQAQQGVGTESFELSKDWSVHLKMKLKWLFYHVCKWIILLRDNTRMPLPASLFVALRVNVASGSNLSSWQNCCTSSGALQGYIITTSPAANLHRNTSEWWSSSQSNAAFILFSSILTKNINLFPLYLYTTAIS